MVAGGEAGPVTLSDLDLDLRSQVFWPRHTMDIPGTPSQMWKLSQSRGLVCFCARKVLSCLAAENNNNIRHCFKSIA